MQNWLSKPDKLVSQLFSVTLCMIWKGRNKLIFKNEKFCSLFIAAAASDSRIQVWKLCRYNPNSERENIIYDCKEFLSSLANVTVKFIRRSKNVAAHELVSTARNLGSRSWVGCVPDPMAKVVCTESSFYRWMNISFRQKKKNKENVTWIDSLIQSPMKNRLN